MATTFDYAPAVESRDVLRLRDDYGLFIDGTFAAPTGGESMAIVEPATERGLARVGVGAEPDVDAAVRAARAAFDGAWSALSARDRGKHLFRLARLVTEHARELAVLQTLETGKPIRESLDLDLPSTAAHLFSAAGWADKLAYAGFGSAPRPVGVAAAILPWTSPLPLLAATMAPALACGNTIVVKPAGATPLTALRLAELAGEAGLPAGVLNVVTGRAETGRALAAHPGVAVVSFTGSAAVGREVARALAGSGRRLTLDLGGAGCAAVVFDDAPVAAAVDGVVDGFLLNSGQSCWATGRLLVSEAVHDEFVTAVRRRVATLRQGDPLDRNTDLGPLHSAARLAAVRALADAAQDEGAERWSAPTTPPERGHWFPPTILTGVAPTHRIAREEICGPLLAVLTFRTPEEAVALADDTPYGRAVAVWTDKGSRAAWLSRRLRTGVVWANTVHRADPTAAAGGSREAGLGRVGGPHGLAPYLVRAHG
jgi:aldehyde dehydrogenase (NAD+)